MCIENILAKNIDKIVRNKYNNSTNEGGGTMSITATELKNNLGKYLLLSATEDVFITKNGKIVAKLTNPNQQSLCSVFYRRMQISMKQRQKGLVQNK